jgi:hypothetical protein
MSASASPAPPAAPPPRPGHGPGPGPGPEAEDPRLARSAALAGGLLLALAAAAAAAPALLADLLARGAEGREAWGRLLAVAPPALALAAAGLLLPAVRRRPAALAACLSFPLALLMTAYHLRPPERLEGDAVHFHRMAAEWPWRPGGWWRYRVLVPWTVSRLPLPVDTGYALVAALCVGGAGPALSLLLRDLGYGPGARFAGVALHLCGFATLYNTLQPCFPDPAALLVLLLAARALVRGRDGELALWLAVGAVTKEVTLFLVPAVYLFKARRAIDPAAALRAGLVALPAGLLFLVLRTLPGEAERFTGFVGGAAWLFPWKHQPHNLARLYSPFAAGWALVVMASCRRGRGLRRPVPREPPRDGLGADAGLPRALRRAGDAGRGGRGPGPRRGAARVGRVRPRRALHAPVGALRLPLGRARAATPRGRPAPSSRRRGARRPRAAGGGR